MDGGYPVPATPSPGRPAHQSAQRSAGGGEQRVDQLTAMRAPPSTIDGVAVWLRPEDVAGRRPWRPAAEVAGRERAASETLVERRQDRVGQLQHAADATVRDLALGICG